MSMRSKNDPPLIDLSVDLADDLDWKAGTLKTFEHHLDISAWAYDPLSGLLAVGTSDGVIDIYGGPGVECRLRLTERIPIRSLHFPGGVFKLLCTDRQNRLHVWDLTIPAVPKLQHIMHMPRPINHVAVSPSHSHAFVALSNGEVHTYDLLCLRASPYVIPNMWAAYEEKSFLGPQFTGGGSQVPIEVHIHPRNLTLLYIGYAGGVILLDLAQRATVKAFEYLLPPGAPGGFGHRHSAILTTRKPELTALAVHPSGHLLVTGHADGSVVFWAVEDEDKPLLALTLDGGQDVNMANADELDAALDGQNVAVDTEREPIFKLAWSGFDNSSDPRGGETILTVLGGLSHKDVSGVTTLLLPAFNPPELPAQSVPGTSLDQTVRKAMRDTVIPLHSHCYTTLGVPQDFLLLPRQQPHFAGCWDPIGILLLSDADQGARVAEAYHFPPPLFFAKRKEAQHSSNVTVEDADSEVDEAVSQEIASTLDALEIDDDPKSLELPAPLWGGPSGAVSGTLVSLDRDVYEIITANRITDFVSDIGLRGGSAWVEDSEGEMKLMKFQPHRILVSHHTDLTVRFRDLSAQLLVSSDTAPMQTDFPNLLPDLTIDVLSALADPWVSTHTSPQLVEEARIASSHLASQSLECAVVLHRGEIVVYRQGGPAHEGPVTQKQLEDEELFSIAHVPVAPSRKFKPYFMMLAGRGPVTACSFADVGFFAAAFQDGSLFVVDMRGPKIILRSSAEEKSQRRSFLHKREVDPVQALTWTIAGMETDPQRRIRLLAIRQSGSTTIYSLIRSSTGSWSIDSRVETTDGTTQPLPGGSLVIDSRNGNKCRADRAGLASTLDASAEDSAKGRCVWVCAGAKGVKCVVDITGERLARVEWPSKSGKVERVAVVQKTSSTVLIAHTDKREALVYSLPYLEHLHSLQLHQSSPEPLSLDETGDYVEWCRHPCGVISAEKYGTVFNVRRSSPYAAAAVDLTYGRTPVPAQPQPVPIGPTTMFNSLMGYITNQGMTGDAIDALLAGPDRPAPKQKLPPRPTLVDKPGSSSSSGRGDSSSRGSYDVQSVATSASRGVGDLYTRLNNALAERGEKLGSLEDSFNSLETGSKNMLSQAKSLAAKQTARRWFSLS